ncbi:MAG: nucleotide sugar dehydrogenase [Pseudomonadota bacterium]
MKISVIGLGYVGAVTAVCLARDGHDVTGVDLDPTKVQLLRDGKAPIIEEGIAEVTAAAAASGRLHVTDDIRDGVAESDLIFVCVGTPSASNGSQDLTAVQRVSEQIGDVLKDADDFPVVVLRSTVYPGSTESLVRPTLEAAAGGGVGEKFGLCFQPEFLREGTSVKDFYQPPFTVIGTDCERSAERVRELFGGFPGEFVVTDFKAAELLKMTCNVFHALKISFANEVGRLGQSLGIDSREVMRLVCMDKSLNISPAYMRPGFAYGGSCLPKDLRAMLYLARTNDIELPVMAGVQQTNGIHIQHAFELIAKAGSRRVGMLGLSFKPGTDDLRESPLVSLAELLIGKGYELRIHDPAVNLARLIGSNKRFIDETIPHIEALMADELGEVIEHADVLVIGQKHPELSALLATAGPGAPHIVDLTDVPNDAVGAGSYTGICW